MAGSSRRLGARSIPAAAASLLTLELLVSCGPHPSPSTQSSAAGGATAGQTNAPQPGSASGETRLGCGTYCQSAGGLNGAGPTGQPAVTIASNGTVTADADGYVPITLTCNLPVQCRGALVLDLQLIRENGKSDLVVNAGATATLGVRLSPRALYFLQYHGPTTAQVTADSGQSPGTGHFDAGAPDGPWVGGVAPVDVKNVMVATRG